MIGKIINKYENINTSAIRSAIADFITSFNNLKKDTESFFPMNTNAKYDNTFNEKYDEILGEITTMTDTCNYLNDNIISVIENYKSYYNSTYSEHYNSYSRDYNLWITDSEKYSQPTTYYIEEDEKILSSYESKISGYI